MKPCIVCQIGKINFPSSLFDFFIPYTFRIADVLDHPGVWRDSQQIKVKYSTIIIWSQPLCEMFPSVSVFELFPAATMFLLFCFSLFLFLCCSLLVQCFSVPECLLWHDRCCLTDPQLGARSIGFAYYSHRATSTYFHTSDKMNCLSWLWKLNIHNFGKGDRNRICGNEACDVFIVPWGLSGTLLLAAGFHSDKNTTTSANQPSTSQKHSSWGIKLCRNWNEVQHKSCSTSTSCIPIISTTSTE